jgi:ATP-dependent DNA helicase DinG
MSKKKPAGMVGIPTGPSIWAMGGPVATACLTLEQAYEPREEQQAVAALVETALGRQETQEVGILPIEAGTGTGKTLAYLVPGALHASASGSRMLVSTHTLALGTQIMRKDGPVAQAVVKAALGQTPRLAHMRGRSHFMSPSRARAIGNLLREDKLPPSAWKPYLDLAEVASQAITQAAAALADGDLSETPRKLVEACLLDRMEEEAGVWLSREDICLLASSPKEELVVHELSRALAENAAILVTTHAYTAVSLARRALFDAATNRFDLLVIDEADQWANAASSVSLQTLSLTDLGRVVEAVLSASRHARDPQEITKRSHAALKLLDKIREMAPQQPDQRQPITRDDDTIRMLRKIASEIEQTLQLASHNKRHTAAAAGVLQDRGETIRRIERAVSNNESDFWITQWKTSRVQGQPSIVVQGKAPGRILKRLWTPVDGATPLARTVVLTSATLTTPGFRDETRWKSIELATGADPSSGMVLTDLAKSIQPRNFGRLRVRFADPRAPIPRVNDAGEVDAEAMLYAAAVVTAAMENSRPERDRTLVLVPSYADVERLRPLLPGVWFHEPGESLERVLDRYRATKGCCLVTPGAWVGADLPGMIQNLVITRIPYPPRQDDGNGHMADTLSAALRRLAQGIGRAIRKHDDHATLWFADPRMPIPECVTDLTGLLPSPAGNSALLGAIPQRFRDDFDRVAGAAGIGVTFNGQKTTGHWTGKTKQPAGKAGGGRRGAATDAPELARARRSNR